MKMTAAVGAVVMTAALSLVMLGCSANSTGNHASTANTKTVTSAQSKVAPRVTNAPGPNPTIASYIQDNGITETPVHHGDPGAPTIKLPTPDGWIDAGQDTPEWAYSAIVFNGQNSGDDTPSIVALLSKLTGNVDQQKLLALAPGELTNLDNFKATSPGSTSTLDGFPAYQLAGTWVQDDQTKFVAQKTVVIPAANGVYVLQLNSDALQDQTSVASAATGVVDQTTTITP